MFIGEAPGKEENITGIPFQGRSGKLLRLHLKQNNFTDENSFITNIVKFRPPKNRKPTKKEILIHSQILKEELKIIKPKIIVPIGLTACVFILESSNIKITQIRGTIIKKNNLIIFPLLHPAYILRNRNIENIFENDIAKLYNCFLNYLK
jgi:DNA polymerase